MSKYPNNIAEIKGEINSGSIKIGGSVRFWAYISLQNETINLKHLSFAASLAGLTLMVASPKAQALSWNFTYSLPLNGNSSNPTISGSGTLDYTGSGDNTFDITSLSFQENGVSGTYTLDNSSNYYQNQNYSGLGKNQIQVVNAAVSSWNFYASNSNAMGDTWGRNFFEDGFGNPALSYTSTGSNYNEVYYNFDLNGTQFTAASATVPFDFSPSPGVALGLPLFIGLRMLKKCFRSD